MHGNQSGKVVEDTLLRPRELAAEFKISVGYLSHLRQIGEGPKFVRFGRAIRYRASSAREFFERCKSEAK